MYIFFIGIIFAMFILSLSAAVELCIISCLLKYVVSVAYIVMFVKFTGFSRKHRRIVRYDFPCRAVILQTN